MNRYPVGTDVTVTIAFQDLNGDVLTPTGLTYTVEDGDGTVLAGPTTIASFTGDSVDITVPGSINNTTGARMVTLNITTADGVFESQAYYAVTASTRIVRLENSFQTYANALFMAADMPGLTGWQAACEADRMTALIEAYQRLTRMNYLVRWPLGVDFQMRVVIPYWANGLVHITPRMWPLMTDELFSPYPDPFKHALYRAQVAEANEILTGDPAGDKRRAGILSESVGESSVMFRSGVAPYEGNVSRAAMRYLTGYLDNKITLNRT
jgi:hypothetical protein